MNTITYPGAVDKKTGQVTFGAKTKGPDIDKLMKGYAMMENPKNKSYGNKYDKFNTSPAEKEKAAQQKKAAPASAQSSYTAAKENTWAEKHPGEVHKDDKPKK